MISWESGGAFCVHSGLMEELLILQTAEEEEGYEANRGGSSDGKRTKAREGEWRRLNGHGEGTVAKDDEMQGVTVGSEGGSRGGGGGGH
eukprot:2983700-Pleurochrysis_carterae.AAC.1